MLESFESLKVRTPAQVLYLRASVDTISLSCNLLQGCHDILDQILTLLNTTADSDQIIKHASGFSLLLRNTHMRHASRELNQTLDTTQTLSQSEDLGCCAETLGSGLATLDAERKHTTTKTVSVLLESDLALRMGVQARVVDSTHVRRCSQCFGDHLAVAACLASTEVKGLDTTVCEPAVKCSGNSTNGVLKEAKALLEVVAVEGCNAHKNIAVPINVLGNTVHHDICAVLKRVLDVRAHEGVVDNNENTVLVGNSGNGRNVNQRKSGVRWCLDPNKLGLGLDQSLNIQLDTRGECDMDTVGLGDLGEVTVSTTVDIRNTDYVRASSKRLENDGCGCRSRAES